MPDHLLDQLQMRYLQHAARCTQGKHCHRFKNTNGTDIEVKKKKKEKTIKKKCRERRVVLQREFACAITQWRQLDAPQRGRLHLVSAPIFLLHSIWPSLANQARPRYPLQSEDAKTNIPALGWCSFLLLSGEATWDKAQARPDTSNQWNPQGLCWVFNEVHCSQLESPSPRNGLTFRLLFVFVLSFGSLQLVDTTTKPPIRRSICLCGQSDSSLSFHHEAKINNLSLVQAHPPAVTPFSLFSAPLQSGITSLFTKNNSWPDSSVVCMTTFGIGDWPVGSLKYKTGHFK